MRYLNNELSNMSYTNKDFNTIYPELLDFADSISDKWKPSLSNESDPGVVLLKLAALMADKNNYNIDKNILELFPMSVTQYANAREIYEQCGYSMHYYRAAEAVVALTPDNIAFKRVAGESDSTALSKGSSVKLPMFTTVSGADNSIVYTLVCDLEDAEWETQELYPEDVVLTYGETTNFVALQGKCNTYMLNGNDYITYENLDYNNRIYFNQKQIAENGIFITNIEPSDLSTNKNNFNSWVRVDNLWTQPPESYCYKVGLSRDTNRVYIEFPSDIASIIGAGIRIYYLVTDGAQGSIRSNYLDSFLNTTCVATSVIDSEDEEKEWVDESLFKEAYRDGFTNDNIHITNKLASSVGKDPESVDEAYRGYERYKNTFNTLVSIADYNNYLRRDSKFLANGFICDRTNDIQHTYRIKSYYNGKTNNDLEQEKDKGIPYLNAFNLRIYGLQGNSSVTNGSEDAFKLSFTPVMDNVHVGNLANFISEMEEDTQTVCHDFIPLTEGKLAFIFLEFTINAKIIPYTKLDTLQQTSVYGYVYAALLRLLNSTNIEFGQAIDYDLVYDTIKSADTRIQSLILDDISYTPVYYVRSNDSTIRRLDPSTDGSTIAKIENEIAAKCVLAGVTPLYIFDRTFSYPMGISSPEKHEAIKSISSSWTKTFSETDGYILRENENIYLKAPNYITQEQFGAYVKCFYKLGEDSEIKIPKDGVYELGQNDYIAFFWKVDDDSDYEYKIFNQGNFIKPAYTINTINPNITQTSDAHREEDAKIRTFIEGAIKGKSRGSFVTGLLVDTDVSNAVSTIQDRTLSGKQSISIVSPNSIVIESDAKLYFRRNTINNNNEFELRDGDILGTGEYIYYTKNPRASIIELGMGTEVKLTDSVTGPIKVKALTTAEQVVEFSLSPLKYLQDNNLWFDCTSLGDGFSELIENQFYNFGENSQIKFEAEDGSSKLKLTSDAFISISYEKESEEELAEVSGEEESKKEIIPYTIRYKSPEDEQWTTIPTILASSGWEGKTFLSLTGSSDTPQELFDGHIITLNSTPISKNEFKYIQFYPQLNLLGDSSSYSFIDSNISALMYTADPGTQESTIVIDKLKVVGDYAVSEHTFGLLEGLYLLPFDLIGPHIDFHTYKDDVVKVYMNNDEQGVTEDGTTKWHIGRNYIFLTAAAANPPQTFNIKFEFNNTEALKSFRPYTLKLYAPLLYTINSTLNINTTSEEQDDVIDIITNLDTDSKFQYDLDIPVGDQIENPTTPNAFLDTNHPYNRCTICKWKLPSEVDNQIKITNKIK